MRHKIGLGYDIHCLQKGRKLLLGGIEIPHNRGLLGHSDGDVVLHAICDALLGACGLGDIGEHFPDTSEEFKGISSTILLDQVNESVKNKGFKIGNVDVVILAEEPKLFDYKDKMRKHIAQHLQISQEDINIKATTHEGLGPIGTKEGIASFATVILEKG